MVVLVALFVALGVYGQDQDVAAAAPAQTPAPTPVAAKAKAVAPAKLKTIEEIQAFIALPENKEMTVGELFSHLEPAPRLNPLFARAAAKAVVLAGVMVGKGPEEMDTEIQVARGFVDYDDEAASDENHIVLVLMKLHLGELNGVKPSDECQHALWTEIQILKTWYGTPVSCGVAQ